MQEISTMDEKTLNLVANESNPKDESGSEIFKQLYEALHPQTKVLVNLAADLYKQTSESLMRLVPGDWDVDRFPVPKIEPVPVSLVRLLDVDGNPSKELELKIRGKDQVALTHTDVQAGTQQEHLFQRINPNHLNPEQRQACADAIQKAQVDLQIDNENHFMNPEQHDMQLTAEIDAFKNGDNVDIWIPFDASGTDSSGNQVTHLINWGGRRPEEVAASYLADMADGSAYRDNPNNVANLVANHLDLHPIADVFKASTLDRVLDYKGLSTTVDYSNQDAVLMGPQTPLSKLDLSDILPVSQTSMDSTDQIIKAIKGGLLEDKNLPRDQKSLEAMLMGKSIPLEELNAEKVLPGVFRHDDQIGSLIDEVKKNNSL